MFSSEIFVELAHRIKAFSKDFLEIRKDGTVQIERIMLGIIFPPGFQDSEVFEIFQFTADSIDLLIYITTKLSDKEVFLRIECMLQEEFFQEFFSAV